MRRLLALLPIVALLPSLSSSPLGASAAHEAACAANDLTALNYALTLEHLEATFYAVHQGKFSAADFTAAGLDSLAYPNFVLIASHEAAHVTALEQTIRTLGGSPAPPCVYNFSAVTDVRSYVAVSKLLENTGVSAYDGSVNTIYDSSLQQVAATIATVEARHAAYLNQLSMTSPFPDEFDTAISPDDIVKAVLATGLITSCPYELKTPVVLVPTKQEGSSAPASQPANAQVLTDAQKTNDLKALNYALTLEHLEAAFYAQGQANYTLDAFQKENFSKTVYDDFTLIAAHEAAHVKALDATITALGGSPVPPCVYDFSAVNNVTAYVTFAKVLENTGVSAYDGAINTIANTQLQQVAATIATVEARHAAVLNQLNLVAPFPDAFDTAVKPEDIVKAVLATGFVVSCPYELVTPNVAEKPCPAPTTPPTIPPTTPPATGEGGSPSNPPPVASGGVCPAITFTNSVSQSNGVTSVTFTNTASRTVQWVDFHVSINKALKVNSPSVDAPMYNYRMIQSGSNQNQFVINFPTTVDVVTIAPTDYFNYFFTYCSEMTDCDTDVFNFTPGNNVPDAGAAQEGAVCTDAKFQQTGAFDGSDFKVTFTNQDQVQVEWVDLHLTITSASTPNLNGQYNYRMANANGQQFTFSAPSVDGVRVPADASVSYFFTYKSVSSFACNTDNFAYSSSPDNGASEQPEQGEAVINGTSVCPAFTFSQTASRSDSDSKLTITLQPEAGAQVEWIDLHVLISSAAPTNGVGAFTPNYNYRMARSGDRFTYTFPGADGVVVPPTSYVQYFFTSCSKMVDCDSEKFSFGGAQANQVVRAMANATETAPGVMVNPNMNQNAGAKAGVNVAVMALIGVATAAVALVM